MQLIKKEYELLPSNNVLRMYMHQHLVGLSDSIFLLNNISILSHLYMKNNSVKIILFS